MNENIILLYMNKIKKLNTIDLVYINNLIAIEIGHRNIANIKNIQQENNKKLSCEHDKEKLCDECRNYFNA